MRALQIFVVSAIVVCVAASSAAALKPPLRVVFVGDSLTESGPVGFPYVVTAGLEKRGFAVTMLLSGRGGVQTRYWETHQIPNRFDIAVVELGTNDAPWRTEAQFTHDYEALIKHLRAKSPTAKFVCLSVWRPEGPNTPPTGAATAPVFSRIIKADCPGPFVNIQQFAHPPYIFAGDHFHPNATGQKLIGQTIVYTLFHHGLLP